MALLLSALAPASPAVKPASADHFVARFDCRVSSTLGGRPLHEGMREVITIRNWDEQSPMLVEVHFEGKILKHEARLMGVSFHESGSFDVDASMYGMFSLQQTAKGSSSFRYDGSSIVFDAGFAHNSGTCSSKIKKRPKKARSAPRIR